MRINKKQVLYTEKFSVFRSDELNKAKKCILKDIDELEQASIKVKQFTIDFDHHILITERSPFMYDGIVPTIIESLSRRITGKKPIRLEKDGRICAIELHIKARTENMNNTEKIIRYFVFKYTRSQDTYVVKKCNNTVYNMYMFLQKKQLKNIVKNMRSESDFTSSCLDVVFQVVSVSRHIHFVERIIR